MQWGLAGQAHELVLIPDFDARAPPGVQPQPYAQTGPSAPSTYGVPAPKGPILQTEAGDWFELAGWWRRAGGLILDSLIVGVPFGIVSVVVFALAFRNGNGSLFGVNGFNGVTGESEGLVPLRLLLVFAETGVAFAYAVWLIGSRRQTWGMQAVGVTAIDPSGRALTRRQVWMRALYRVLFVSLWANLLSAAVIIDHRRHAGLSTAASLVPVALDAVVYLWVLGSERNQTLIDKAAGSVVVRGNRLGLAAVAAVAHELTTVPLHAIATPPVPPGAPPGPPPAAPLGPPPTAAPTAPPPTAAPPSPPYRGT
jgi:uncharacterized RDD family membrane protein YckC